MCQRHHSYIPSCVHSRLDKVFIQAFGLACEVYVEVSLLCSLPTMVCKVTDSVVCQVAMLPSFNSLCHSEQCCLSGHFAPFQQWSVQ